ncbi:MAG: hypothetical protein H8D38_06005 [DPANN group archaeon]|nr:hypothetical protein [DPANN group archaeon]
MKDLYKKLLLAFIASFLALVIIEGLLRSETIMNKITGKHIQDTDIPMNNLNISKEYLSNACQIFKGKLERSKKYVGFNREGFRDYEYDYNKPNNTFRIILIGSSFTVGMGNKLEDTFGKQLEVLLNNKSKNLKYEVLILAQGGTYFATKLCILNNTALKFNPDLILFKSRANGLIDIFFMNEQIIIDYLENKRPDEIYLDSLFDFNKDKEKIKLAGLVQQLIDRRDASKKYHTGDLWKNERLKSNYINKLKEFKNICDENNISCIAFLSPENAMNDNNKNRLIKIFKEIGFSYFDLLDYFSYPMDRYWFTNNKHPSPFYHKITAYSLYNELIANKILPNWAELELTDISKIKLEKNEFYECTKCPTKENNLTFEEITQIYVNGCCKVTNTPTLVDYIKNSFR